MSETVPPGSWPGAGAEGESALAPDPVKTAVSLTDALSAMTAQLAQVKATVRRGKHIAIALAIALIFDVALTVVVSITAVQAHDTSARANATVAQLHAIQLASCKASNQIRGAEVGLWEKLARLSTTARTTRAQRKTDQELIAYIKMVFRAKDCRAIYRLPS